MLYAILCYNSEAAVEAWSQEEEDAVLAQRAVVVQDLAAREKVGPIARLMPTKSAITVRGGREPLVVDGPFAETKEQLLGFYVVDCESADEAIQAARRMVGQTGALEVRPLRSFAPAGGRK